MAVNHNLKGKALDDFKIIEQILKGDKSGYEKIVKKYKATLQYMAFKIVKSEVEAEDIVMMSLGKAFESLNQYNPEYAFSTWLFRITSNKCIDYIRQKKENQISLNDSASDDLPEFGMRIKSGVLTPEEDLIRQQRISVINDVVQSLKPVYRQLIELRYFEEYSYEEIAEKLDLPLGTVKTQLHRAKTFLQFTVLGKKGRF